MIPVVSTDLPPGAPLISGGVQNQHDGLASARPPYNFTLQTIMAYFEGEAQKSLVAGPSFPLLPSVPALPNVHDAADASRIQSMPGACRVAPQVQQNTGIPISVICPQLQRIGPIQPVIIQNGIQGICYQGIPLVQNPGYIIPFDHPDRESLVASPQRLAGQSQPLEQISTFKSSRIRWSAEMSKDLEDAYDKLSASHMRPTQRAIHEILKRKYPNMTELHVQSKLQKLRQIKKAAMTARARNW